MFPETFNEVFYIKQEKARFILNQTNFIFFKVFKYNKSINFKEFNVS